MASILLATEAGEAIVGAVEAGEATTAVTATAEAGEAVTATAEATTTTSNQIVTSSSELSKLSALPEGSQIALDSGQIVEKAGDGSLKLVKGVEEAESEESFLSSVKAGAKKGASFVGKAGSAGLAGLGAQQLADDYAKGEKVVHDRVGQTDDLNRVRRLQKMYRNGTLPRRDDEVGNIQESPKTLIVERENNTNGIVTMGIIGGFFFLASRLL